MIQDVCHRRSKLALWLLVACSGVAGLLATLPGASEASELRRTPIVKAVEEARPAVVNIHGRKTVRSEDPQRTGENFRQVNGMGTGIIVDERGFVLTNHHVVDSVSRIQVTTHDQRSFVARLIAYDFKTDLAVIKIDSDQPFQTIRVGTSSDLMPGETVIAVGNAFGYEHTVTSGIISALHRTVQVSDEQTYRDVIQTNADINPGNSGGPLLNIDGDLIGVNVAVRVGAQGIAFTIPVDTAMEVAAQLMSTERVEKLSHGLIGKTVWQAGNARAEFVVSSLRDESIAADAGLQPGDVVMAVGDTRVERALDFERALIGRQGGEELAVEVRRGQERVKLSMKVDLNRRGGGGLQERAWELIGVRLEQLPPDRVQSVSSRYNGGLKVTDVRADGPAARQGIRRGDVLVGMHKWETVTLDNVKFIFDSSEFAKSQPVKFYILRGGETLYGHLRVSTNTR
jgi:serine protease Do